jgi:hypothetical protein
MNSCCAAHGIGEVEIDAEFLKVNARVQLAMPLTSIAP